MLGSKLLVLGMVIQPWIGTPYNGYINPYYWVDDHPLLYGNNGSLEPGTYMHNLSKDNNPDFGILIRALNPTFWIADVFFQYYWCFPLMRNFQDTSTIQKKQNMKKTHPAPLIVFQSFWTRCSTFVPPWLSWHASPLRQNQKALHQIAHRFLSTHMIHAS